jgi:hypothetical protein
MNVRDLVVKSRAAQGLPTPVADPVVIARLAALLRPTPDANEKAAPERDSGAANAEVRRVSVEHPT